MWKRYKHEVLLNETLSSGRKREIVAPCCLYEVNAANLSQYENSYVEYISTFHCTANLLLYTSGPTQPASTYSQ